MDYKKAYQTAIDHVKENEEQYVAGTALGTFGIACYLLGMRKGHIEIDINLGVED